MTIPNKNTNSSLGDFFRMQIVLAPVVSSIGFFRNAVRSIRNKGLRIDLNSPSDKHKIHLFRSSLKSFTLFGIMPRQSASLVTHSIESSGGRQCYHTGIGGAPY